RRQVVELTRIARQIVELERIGVFVSHDQLEVAIDPRAVGLVLETELTTADQRPLGDGLQERRAFERQDDMPGKLSRVPHLCRIENRWHEIDDVTDLVRPASRPRGSRGPGNDERRVHAAAVRVVFEKTKRRILNVRPAAADLNVVDLSWLSHGEQLLARQW